MPNTSVIHKHIWRQRIDIFPSKSWHAEFNQKFTCTEIGTQKTSFSFFFKYSARLHTSLAALGGLEYLSLGILVSPNAIGFFSRKNQYFFISRMFYLISEIILVLDTHLKNCKVYDIHRILLLDFLSVEHPISKIFRGFFCQTIIVYRFWFERIFFDIILMESANKFIKSCKRRLK